MSEDTIRLRFEQYSSEELLEIWIANDRDEYADETFTVIFEILSERGVNIPPQGKHASKIQYEDEASIGNYFNFKWLISSSLIQIIYVVGMIAVSFIGLIAIGRSAVFGIVILIFGNLMWRITCEGFILFFRIHDSLVSIDKKLSHN